MKTVWRLFVLVYFCLACVLPHGLALSEAQSVAAGLSEALKGTPYAGYAILRYSINAEEAHAYAIASSEGKNVLCAFAASAGGGWDMRFANENAVYEGTDLPYFYSEGSIISLAYETAMPIISIAFSNMDRSAGLDFPLRQVYTASSWEKGKGPLRIKPIREEGDKGFWKVDGYFEDMEFSGWGNCKMSDFDIHAFPSSVEEAKVVWQLEISNFVEYATDANLLEMVPGLSSTWLELPKGASYDVYSGPGNAYLRGANGKARVSTNEPLHLYGRAGEWALVSYDIAHGERYGYIPASALDSVAQTQPLRQSPVSTGYIREDTAALRDNPDRKSDPLRTLKRGDEVRVLGVLADWIYVDDSPTNPQLPCRGFVWFSDLTLGANY